MEQEATDTNTEDTDITASDDEENSNRVHI